MAYNKKIWANGDLITKESMNNIENGIYNAHDEIASLKNNTSTGGGSGEVDLSGYVTKETGNANQITFADGQTFQAKLDAGTLKGNKGDKGDKGDPGSTEASGVSIQDTANNFTATNVEGALQEVGSQIKDIANNFTTEQTDTEIILKYADTTILTIPLSGLTPTEKAELLSSNLCFYEPTDVPNTWATDSSGKILNVDTEAFYDLFYNPYVGTNSDGYTVTKTELGKDQSNTYPLYEYDFKPTNYNRTILLTSGMHTYELSAHFGCAWLIKSIMEKYNDNIMLKYLHDNVRIKIIPIVNPWGWNQSPKKYGNANGVNINRNFDYQDENGNSAWEQFPVHSGNPSDSNYNEWNVKGDAPFSESESQILRDWVLSNKDKAEFWIDCHTGLGIGPWDNFIYYSSNSTLVDRITNALGRLEDRIWNTYHITPTRECRIDTPDMLRLAWGEKVAGVPGMTVEQTPNNTKWGTSLNNESGDIANYCTTLLTYIMEFLVTNYDVKYASNREEYNINSANIDFAIGSIAFATGVINSTDKTRAYTDFIPIETGDNIYIDTDYPYYAIIGYDNNKSYVKALTGNWNNTKPNSIFNNNTNIKYIRVLCKIDDTTEITNSIISSHYVTINTTRYTQNGSSAEISYVITNNLTNATSSNAVSTVKENSSYTTTITANSGYSINTITVTMAGIDITSTVVNGNTISIANVTGNIIITATTIEAGEQFIELGGIYTNGVEADNNARFRTNYIEIDNGITNVEEISTTLSKKTVDWNNGSESNSTTRVSTDYIPINNKEAVSIKTSVFSDALLRYFKYENGVYTFVGSSGNTWGKTFEINNNLGATHFRVVFRKLNDATVSDSDLDTSKTTIKLHSKAKDVNLNLGTKYAYYFRLYDENKQCLGDETVLNGNTLTRKTLSGNSKVYNGTGIIRYSNPYWRYIRLIGMNALDNTAEIDINNLEGNIEIDGVTYNLTNS